MVQPKLSVVIVARNEEKRLPDCVASVRDYVDEIVVVDDQSTDNTRELAASLGAKVFSRKMENEGRHRNWAYAQATGEWVFSVDADERPTPELMREMRQAIADTEHTHFCIPFKNYIGKRWVRRGGWYPAPKVKLFKRGFFKYAEVQVHPPIITEGTCGRLNNDVLHYSYRDWEDFFRKTNILSTLEAQKWYDLSLKDPKKAGAKMNLVHALWRTFDRFFRHFVVKQGFRDGLVGLMVAYGASMYQLISYVKYVELKERERSVHVS
jgi:glycosyltransferase involved in cell wall biosynthesis